MTVAHRSATCDKRIALGTRQSGLGYPAAAMDGEEGAEDDGAETAQS